MDCIIMVITMQRTAELENKVKLLERRVRTLEAKLEELDLSYSMVLKVIEQEIDSGNLKLDMCSFEN